MPTARTEGKPPGIFETLRSLQFGIVVLVSVAAVAVLGTLIPQGQPLEFYREHMNPVTVFFVEVFRLDDTYGSPLFLGLLGLFGLNLVLCTLNRFPAVIRAAFRPNQTPGRSEIERMPAHIAVTGISLENTHNAFKNSGFHLKRLGNSRLFGEKGRMGYLGSTIVHLSLLLFLIGGMVSLVTGTRGQVVLQRGESTSLAVLPNGAKIPLGFTVRLDRFTVAFYDDWPDRPKSFTSSVTVTRRDGSTFQKDIMVNHPLMLNGVTMYQSSFGASDEMRPADAANDTAVVEIRLRDTPEDIPPVVILEMVRGETYPVPGFGDSILVRLAELHRNFRMGASEEGENPAVKLDVLVGGEVRWSVYAFRKYPGLNMPMHKDIDFSFVMRDLRAGGFHQAGAPPEFYTVLGMVRDRGITLVGAGAVLMMLGLLLSFSIRPRRLWALEEDGTVFVGGQVKGDRGTFREYIENVIRKTETHGGNGDKS